VEFSLGLSVNKHADVSYMKACGKSKAQ